MPLIPHGKHLVAHSSLLKAARYNLNGYSGLVTDLCQEPKYAARQAAPPFARVYSDEVKRNSAPTWRKIDGYQRFEKAGVPTPFTEKFDEFIWRHLRGSLIGCLCQIVSVYDI